MADEPRGDADVEGWGRTDRQFRFPERKPVSRGGMESSCSPAPRINPARLRWLEANDVHTQFLDAGIGCCWWAQQGDDEPVSGETEDEALARLATKNGLELWSEE